MESRLEEILYQDEIFFPVILSSVNVYALKTRATYSCSAEHAIEALWFLNGTDSRELNLTNTTDFFFSTTNVGIFIFQYLTGVYNNTHIQCEALFPSGPPERSGNNKTLVIQGNFFYFYACGVHEF